MALLSEYSADLRDLLNDPNARKFTPTQAARWINRARRRIAAEAQCIRVLPPSSGSVASVTVTSGGTGYSTPPQVVFSPPEAFGGGGVTAAATATILAGAVIAVTVDNPGVGYVATPTIAFTGGGGSGAAATAIMTPFYKTVAGQEVYPFTDINPLLGTPVPGAGAVIGIQSLSISWGNYKPTLDYLPWTAFQAYCRAWNWGPTTFPRVWSQYGQGKELGSFYLWPKPAQTLQIDADCYCTPIPLVDDSTIDALPEPWTDGVQFLAAKYAYLNAQRADDATRMEREYKKHLIENRMYVTPSRLPSLYGMG